MKAVGMNVAADAFCQFGYYGSERRTGGVGC